MIIRSNVKRRVNNFGMDIEDLPGYGIGHRHIQVALIFSMVVIMYTINMSIPVVLVAITDQDSSPNPDIPIYPNWTDQSLILISFYWGNAPTQLLGGPLSRKYGTKCFMVLSMLIVSFISFSIPSIIEIFGSEALMKCFFIQGLCQGFIIPMGSEFISKWVPLSELTTTGTWIFGGVSLGSVVATEISGDLSTSWYGWPSVFYFNAAVGIIWSIFMVIFGCSNPNEHTRITVKELEYINRGKHLTKKRIPWSHIIKSSPTWATWIVHICIIWSTRLCATEFPTYMNRALGFSVETCSKVLTISYLIAYLHTFLVSSISQFLINKNYCSISACRKICNSVASWGAAFNLILLGTYSFNGYMEIFIICLIFLCINTSFSGFTINYNDLSPNYAACLFGIGGIAATVISFIPVTLVQWMVTDQKNTAQWEKVFWLAAIVSSLGNLFFVWKGSGKIQDWDDLNSIGNSPSRGAYLDIDKESLLPSEGSG